MLQRITPSRLTPPKFAPVKSVSDYDKPTKTSISDLVLICSNCHRMIHRKKPWLSIDELKELKGVNR